MAARVTAPAALDLEHLKMPKTQKEAKQPKASQLPHT